jgi:hypothetical protein
VKKTMGWVGALVATALGAMPVPAQEQAAEALLAVVAVERAMLDEARERCEALSRRRGDLSGEIELLRVALDSAVHEREAPDYRRVNQLAEQLERAEHERAGLLRSERLLIDRIAQHLQRLEIFEQEVDSLQARQDESEGLLTGAWDIVLMPTQQRGTAALQQAGALVSGTYELEGGWSGSLQGTLVNRKVFLVRIDSKLGKSMELEGYLSSDGKRIRGSWLNYELAGGEGATGQWTAQRRAGGER